MASTPGRRVLRTIAIAAALLASIIGLGLSAAASATETRRDAPVGHQLGPDNYQKKHVTTVR